MKVLSYELNSQKVQWYFWSNIFYVSIEGFMSQLKGMYHFIECQIWTSDIAWSGKCV